MRPCACPCTRSSPPSLGDAWGPLNGWPVAFEEVLTRWSTAIREVVTAQHRRPPNPTSQWARRWRRRAQEREGRPPSPSPDLELPPDPSQQTGEQEQTQNPTNTRASGRARQAAKARHLQRLYRANPGVCMRRLLEATPPVFCGFLSQSSCNTLPTPHLLHWAHPPPGCFQTGSQTRWYRVDPCPSSQPHAYTTWWQRCTMAAIHLSPPEPFNFNKPDEWGRWKRRFDQYRVASGLSKEKDDRQVSTLLYCLGDQAEDVLASTGISEEEREGYKKVLDTLDKFFKVRKNVIFERARFNQRAQTDGETAEEYITALHNLVQDCEYGELKDEMLRDRLVVGIKDTALSQKLQLDSELTLEKAMKAVRQKEAVREQYQTLTGGDKELNQVRSESRNSLGPAKKGKACTRCGREAHPIEKCPAKTVTCYRCQKKGHFSAHCRTGTAAAVHSTQPRAESNTAFLGPLASSNESCWTTEIEMCNTPVTFKVDTGAEVTAISKETFKCLQNLPLQKPIKILSGPTGEHLAVKGQFTATLSYQGKTCMEPVYVA
ncbi:hypothetical protein EMCRGX_G005382 [Ephydatia muelleri]